MVIVIPSVFLGSRTTVFAQGKRVASVKQTFTFSVFFSSSLEDT